MYVEHPLIRPESVEVRSYQEGLARSCIGRSSLVVMPTGLGKTAVALLVAARRLEAVPGKVLILAPTKPLAQQHRAYFTERLLAGEAAAFTGEVSPKKRSEMWENSRVIVSTPQVIENDLISQRISLRDVVLLVFDEAHRAVGNYSYVFIAQRYIKEASSPLVLGITASPGSSAAKMMEVASNLGVENVEIRSKFDPDVLPYVQEVKVDWVKVGMPRTLGKINVLLRDVREDKIRVLQGFGFIPRGKLVSTKDLLNAQKAVQLKLKQRSGAPSSVFRAAQVLAEAMKINHAVELAQTQGASALHSYLERLEKESRGKGSPRATKALMADPRVAKAMALSTGVDQEHPKLDKVAAIVEAQLRMKPDSRIIVFTHYRDTSDLVARRITAVAGARPVRFVGQADRGEDKGLNQKEQAALVARFKEGIFNTLVATSVAEEGLDIPETDLVVFFEPIPSEIRTIQRRGRTGRRMAGRVVVLITTNTIDEGYYWSAKNKEKRMHEELAKLRAEMARRAKGRSDSSEILAPAPAEPERPLDEFQAEAPPAEPVSVPRDLEEMAFSRIPGEAAPQHEAVPARPGEDGARKNADHAPAPPAMPAPLEHAPTAPEPPEAPAPGHTVEFEISMAAPPSGQSARPAVRGQTRLGDFDGPAASAPPANSQSGLVIIVDHREFNSPVVRRLAELDVQVASGTLPAGDYILSDRLGVERKDTRDFVMSLRDGRLFAQAKTLASAYQRPMMVLEGEDVMRQSGIAQDALLGAIASITADYGITMMTTAGPDDTARYLFAAARRERAEGRVPSIRGGKVTMTLPESQQFILEGLPGVSATLARRLIEHFGSVQAVFNASEEELTAVRGIGAKTARAILDVVRAKSTDG